MDKAVFDEKFQINTLLEFADGPEKPAREKISKMILVLDKKYLGEKDEANRLVQIADASLNMADFGQGEYKYFKLPLNLLEDSPVSFQEGECYLELGLKGYLPQKKEDPGFQRQSTSVKQVDSAKNEKQANPVELLMKIEMMDQAAK